ncbi:RagB/SusD family nutrient uptake outer membrane protein [Pedobacter agri]|uniref:RagB/SusD family nutrient uptake outer membrane protein n=1 Tax=Pedobacter agri TaxID=454586 RepID=UPI00292DB6A5|nr:RagB/SusD family nutrient uptake outer membrane protein [Pedobacter agri]
MKIYIYIIALFTLGITSCKKEFLEIPPKTALTDGVYFTSAKDFQNAVNGIYSPLRGFYGSAWVMGELRSDNTTYNFNPNDRGSIAPEFIKDFTDDSNNGFTAGKYSGNYTMIARANQVLSLIDGLNFDSSLKNNLKGQAYFLRALAYFDLVQYFGSVPIHLTPVKTLAETALPLSTAEAVYAQVIADAKQAATLLPPKASQEAGRATSGAAKMLLGNVYIVQKKWSDAEATLKDITGYSLMANYADVFDPNKKNNAESLFEVQYKQGPDGFASNFFYQFLVQPITGAETQAITGIPESSRNVQGFNIPTPDIISAYESNDLRKAESISTLTASGKPYPYIKKYAHAHALTNNTDDNWPVYRYAETLLFLAEASNELNKTAEAAGYLNQVRSRAGLAPTSATTQSTLRDAILQERRVELAFENKRWLDLVRTGNAVSVMTAYGQRVKANPQAYYFPAGITVSPSAFTNIRLLFPLPASEAALTPFF